METSILYYAVVFVLGSLFGLFIGAILAAGKIADLEATILYLQTKLALLDRDFKDFERN